MARVNDSTITLVAEVSMAGMIVESKYLYTLLSTNWRFPWA